MPKFNGKYDADAYLSWEIKVDKIFHVHNYSEAKKVAVASLEFEDYANVWWEQVVEVREENLQEPIATWEEMKSEMHKRFVPRHQVRGIILQGNGNDHDAHQVGRTRRTNNGTFLQWIELSH
jgi:hypothetical protein